jgi:hypothetical protein
MILRVQGARYKEFGIHDTQEQSVESVCRPVRSGCFPLKAVSHVGIELEVAIEILIQEC